MRWEDRVHAKCSGAPVAGAPFTAGSGNGGLNNEPGGLLTQLDNRFDNKLPDDHFT